jgi:hypothetical protein
MDVVRIGFDFAIGFSEPVVLAQVPGPRCHEERLEIRVGLLHITKDPHQNAPS